MLVGGGGHSKTCWPGRWTPNISKIRIGGMIQLLKKQQELRTSGTTTRHLLCERDSKIHPAQDGPQRVKLGWSRPRSYTVNISALWFMRLKMSFCLLRRSRKQQINKQMSPNQVNMTQQLFMHLPRVPCRGQQVNEQRTLPVTWFIITQCTLKLQTFSTLLIAVFVFFCQKCIWITAWWNSSIDNR